VVAITTGLIIDFSFEMFGLGLPYGMSGRLFALLISMILFVIVSLMDRPGVIAKDIERVMDY